MNLTSASDLVRITTTSTADIEVQASWVDQTTTDFTPGRTNTIITSATTTTIVGSPGGSTQRAVTSLKIRNDHASATNTVTILHTDGTTSVDMFQRTLAAGESIQYDGKVFRVFTSGGVEIYSQGGGPVDVQVFSALGAGTWTKPTSFTPSFVRVILYGGGGGGGVGGGVLGVLVFLLLLIMVPFCGQTLCRQRREPYNAR
jgi:hypothetical protein